MALVLPSCRAVSQREVDTVESLLYKPYPLSILTLVAHIRSYTMVIRCSLDTGGPCTQLDTTIDTLQIKNWNGMGLNSIARAKHVADVAVLRADQTSDTWSCVYIPMSVRYSSDRFSVSRLPTSHTSGFILSSASHCFFACTSHSRRLHQPVPLSPCCYVKHGVDMHLRSEALNALFDCQAIAYVH